MLLVEEYSTQRLYTLCPVFSIWTHYYKVKLGQNWFGQWLFMRSSQSHNLKLQLIIKTLRNTPYCNLTPRGWDKVIPVFQMISPNACGHVGCMNLFQFGLKLHWNLFNWQLVQISSDNGLVVSRQQCITRSNDWIWLHFFNNDTQFSGHN